MNIWLQYFIAFVVGCHGIIYIPFGLYVRGEFKEWRGQSLILGSAVTADRLKPIVLGLNVTAGLATVACALAIAFAPWVPGLWRPLALMGGILGIAAFGVFWDGQSKFAAEEGAIGASISLLLVVSAIVFPGAFG